MNWILNQNVFEKVHVKTSCPVLSPYGSWPLLSQLDVYFKCRFQVSMEWKALARVNLRKYHPSQMQTTLLATANSIVNLVH